MPIRSFTEHHAVKLLATQSRRADISSLELCQVHHEMGKYLANQILESFSLQEVEINHVQGKRTGFALAEADQIAIIGILRAGLYAAEGIRSVFSASEYYLIDTHVKLPKQLLNKHVILVDSVINTGRTIEAIIREIQQTNAKRIIVATLVMQEAAVELATKFPEVTFYALRVSENQYTGRGGTDTGNRLFNT